MRHRKSGVKLNRSASHRQAMFRNMVTSLFKYDRLKTTDAKAKELRRWADHVITLAKRGDLHARRMAMSIVREKNVVHKLFEEAPARFGSISGGYTRIVKIGRRAGDAAAMTLVELIGTDAAKPKKAKPPQPPAAPQPPADTDVASDREPKTADAADADGASAGPTDAAPTGDDEAGATAPSADADK